jgi:hypothetical protein
MYTFIEIWSPKPEWFELSTDDRNALMGRMSEATGPVRDRHGIEVLGWAHTAPDTAHVIAYDYFAVWTGPTKAALDELAAAIDTAGWYTYFDQQVAIGDLVAPPTIVTHMINRSA